MPESISVALRQQVYERVNGHCESCLLSEAVATHRHEPDHIIPKQHDGTTILENLALACARCNRYKGYNVGSFDPQTGDLVPFFNPRKQVWSDHFRLEGAIIQPLTAQGRVTVKMLHLNEDKRLEERARLIAVNLYP